ARNIWARRAARRVHPKWPGGPPFGGREIAAPAHRSVRWSPPRRARSQFDLRPRRRRPTNRYPARVPHTLTIGCTLPASTVAADPGALAALGQAAEDLGF